MFFHLMADGVELMPLVAAQENQTLDRYFLCPTHSISRGFWLLPVV